MTAARTVRVYEVLIDTDGVGPAGDGTVVRRFKRLSDAEACAKHATCYGRPATVSASDVPRTLACRWGMA